MAEGLRRFGISPKSTNLLMVRIGPKLNSAAEKEALQREMMTLSGGRLVTLDTLTTSLDVSAMKKVRAASTNL